MSTTTPGWSGYATASAWAAAFFACLLMGASLHAQEAGPDDDISRIPQRPPARFLDLARWFSLAEKEQTARELERLFDEQKIDLYMVTRTEQPPQGAENYARSLGEAWSRSPMWCVIFHVPGDPEGFHVQAGMAEVKPEVVAGVIAGAAKRAKRESTEKEQVMAAWRDCAVELRFLYAQVQRLNEKRAREFEEARRQWIAEQRQKKILKVAILGGSVVLLVVIFAVVVLVRRKRALKAFEFPETSWRRRYQAPYSGGGGIVARYRVPE